MTWDYSDAAYGPDATPGEQRFGLTAWPESPLTTWPVPTLEPVIDGDEIRWTSSGRRETPLRAEFVIRDLLAVDLDDEQALLGFLKSGGPVFHRAMNSKYVSVRYAASSVELDETYNDPRRNILGGRRTTPIAEVQHMVRLARSMSLHWLDHLEGLEVASAWTSARGGHEISPLFSAHDPEAPWGFLTAAMNWGLEPFHARVGFRRTDGGVHFEDPWPDLYSAMALQLFNIMNEDLPLRHCERCGRRFFRHLGRGRHGQNRVEGQVLYCSRSCANAQSQANWRRKQKERKSLEEGKQ